MKAVVLTGIREMELRDVPEPELSGAHDVLLEMGAVGVCGSDVHYYTTGRIGSQVVRYPFGVGHECAGTVREVGAGVTRVEPGQRVAVEPAVHCGACDQCRAGRPHTCRNLLFLGCPGQLEGCLREYMIMPESCCYPVRRDLPLALATAAEPLSIGAYSAWFARPLEGAAIGILGCGPIGLSVLLVALREGAGPVYVTDRIDARLRVARDAGATWTGNPDTTDVVEAVTKQQPLLLDAVIECCGQQDALDQAVELLKPGGKLILVGIPEVDRVSFTIDRMRRKELSIQNVRRQNGCFQAALDLVQNGEVSVDFMITHRFPLERTREAFDLVAAYGDGVVKAVVEL